MLVTCDHDRLLKALTFVMKLATSKGGGKTTDELCVHFQTAGPKLRVGCYQTEAQIMVDIDADITRHGEFQTFPISMAKFLKAGSGDRIEIDASSTGADLDTSYGKASIDVLTRSTPALKWDVAPYCEQELPLDFVKRLSEMSAAVEDDATRGNFGYLVTSDGLQAIGPSGAVFFRGYHNWPGLTDDVQLSPYAVKLLPTDNSLFGDGSIKLSLGNNGFSFTFGDTEINGRYPSTQGRFPKDLLDKRIDEFDIGTDREIYMSYDAEEFKASLASAGAFADNDFDRICLAADGAISLQKQIPGETFTNTTAFTKGNLPDSAFILIPYLSMQFLWSGLPKGLDNFTVYFKPDDPCEKSPLIFKSVDSVFGVLPVNGGYNGPDLTFNS